MTRFPTTVAFETSIEGKLERALNEGIDGLQRAAEAG
jgi:hypothetical protein